jgi:hypothetical protein
MKEFVAQVDEIMQAMQAMQARASLPESASCAECGQIVAEWRCDDCIGGKILCRFCMQQAHFPNPFHRIECWTRTHFQKAALWEVGVYLVLPHQSSPSICPNLSWQQGLLEKLQKKKDTILQKYIPTSPNECDYTHAAESATDLNQEASQDEVTMWILDKLLKSHNLDEVLEEDETNNQVDVTEADIQDMDTATASFTNYTHDILSAESAVPSQSGIPMHHILGAKSANPSQSSMPFPLKCNALSNQYVRVVHTNGIHHIALLSCTCQGHERIMTDLIYARWMPTSFVRVRTIFAVAILDHFHYCNLEMRSSAYQLFQLLRRVTNSRSPSKVVNLYHELR